MKIRFLLFFGLIAFINQAFGISPCNYYKDSNGICKYCDTRWRQASQKDTNNGACYQCTAICIVPLLTTAPTSNAANSTNTTNTTQTPQKLSILDTNSNISPIAIQIDDGQLLQIAQQNSRAAWLLHAMSARGDFVQGQFPRNGSASFQKKITKKAADLLIMGHPSSNVSAALDQLPAGSYEDIVWTFSRDQSGSFLTFKSHLANENGEIVAEVQKPIAIKLQQISTVVFKVITWSE